ncbi:MAG: Uma2 family endonuclease [Gemmataceae bacterium]|nr:Uma2 family endonuclease [Gemmataceae bacterium]
MATVTANRKRMFGPESAGTLMTPREFDRAEFIEGHRYELIHGVLVVSPSPLENERDPNEELGYWLRVYRDTHPEGAALDATLPEQTVATKVNRHRADRAIWAGLGRLPRRKDVPTIVVEFVSAGKKDRTRDYEEKRNEYIDRGVKEYWILDRFQKTLTVHTPHGPKSRKRVYRAKQTYTTALLPGFELKLARLFELADRWPESPEE